MSDTVEEFDPGSDGISSAEFLAMFEQLDEARQEQTLDVVLRLLEEQRYVRQTLTS
ncbi:MAG: hypothetical protein ABI662_03440 [Dermatophilaceae bacterium]